LPEAILNKKFATATAWKGDNIIRRQFMRQPIGVSLGWQKMHRERVWAATGLAKSEDIIVGQ
jgi:hypothetical protein